MRPQWGVWVTTAIIFGSGIVLGYVAKPEGMNQHTFHIQRIFVQEPCQDPGTIVLARWN